MFIFVNLQKNRLKQFLQRILQEIMRKEYNLEYQTLGWQVICQGKPANQRIIL